VESWTVIGRAQRFLHTESGGAGAAERGGEPRGESGGPGGDDADEAWSRGQSLDGRQGQSLGLWVIGSTVYEVRRREVRN
jgi:hypothetical protein